MIGKILAIGGSDPSGGAGIQADLKTLVDLGVYPYTVITAVTAQNSTGVLSYDLMPARLIREQVEAVAAEGDISGVKTGMLGSSENILEVAHLLDEHHIRFSVIDPVIRASDGRVLTSEASVAVLKKRLLSKAFMVTPNLGEAELLTGVTIKGEDDLLKAAAVIKDTGVAWVLIKGGHLEGDRAVDMLFDGAAHYAFEAQRVEGAEVRGTGCMLASAICAHLVRGSAPADAVDKAKAYVLKKIKTAVLLGKGSRQAIHFCPKGRGEFQHREEAYERSSVEVADVESRID